MAEFRKLVEFFEFLKKSIMIVSKNGKLMAIVTSIYVIIASLFFVLNISTIKPLILDFVSKSMVLPSQDPQGLIFAQILNMIQVDFKTILATELVYILTIFITSLVAQNAIILLVGVAYKNEKISLQDLILRVPKSLTRMFITSFHVTLLRVGFFYIGFFSIMAPTIVVSSHKIVSKLILYVLMVIVVSLYLYFSVVWILSLVISVLEESSGIEALGRAGKLVKGKKLEGFLLNLLLNLLSYVFVHWLSKMIVVKQSELTQALYLFFMMCFICSIAVLEFQAYTVLYFECKKNHGEEIELELGVEYSKIPRIPLVSEDLP